ncbi:Uncharacterised protein [Mycobacteroides abscessus subsp. abscessus]|nr:Uncharacterised protein [Mycobacteroides abscessus subsp. abscessus]
MSDIERALLDAINKSDSLRRELGAYPDKVADTVREFTPTRTGETRRSIEDIQARNIDFERIGTHPVKIGEVFSDEPADKIASIEYGRKHGNHGETQGAFMFARAAAYWNERLS